MLIWTPVLPAALVSGTGWWAVLWSADATFPVATSLRVSTRLLLPHWLLIRRFRRHVRPHISHLRHAAGAAALSQPEGRVRAGVVQPPVEQIDRVEMQKYSPQVTDKN